MPQWEIVHKQINYRQVNTNSSFDLIYKLRCAALNSRNVRFSTFQDFFFGHTACRILGLLSFLTRD